MKIVSLRSLNRLVASNSLELPAIVTKNGEVLFVAYSGDSVAIPRASVSTGEEVEEMEKEKEEEPADDYAEKFKTPEGKVENTPSWAASLVGDLETKEEEKIPDDKGWLPTGRCEMPFCKGDAVAMAKKYNTETGEENDIAVCKRHYSLYLKEQGK